MKKPPLFMALGAALFIAACDRGPAPAGQKGDPGPQGVAGPQGPRGEQGPPGAQGPVGEKGEKGDRGDVGPQGAAGPQGPRGEQGPPGAQGQTGEKGNKGDPGAAGPQGAPGPMGEKGAGGAAGLSGLRLVDEPSNNTVTCGEGEMLFLLSASPDRRTAAPVKSRAPGASACERKQQTEHGDFIALAVAVVLKACRGRLVNEQVLDSEFHQFFVSL